MSVVQPGAGYALATPTPMSVLCRADQTAGGLLVLDQTLAPGSISPAHNHSEETQGAYVLEGEITFWTEGEEETVGPGGYAVRPAGALHSLWNATDRPARMLELTTPAARFEAFVREMDRGAREGSLDPAAVATLAADHGTNFDVQVTAQLCERHGVSTAASPFTR
jgi:quercetin dioxygenase-like cupin family protein